MNIKKALKLLKRAQFHSKRTWGEDFMVMSMSDYKGVVEALTRPVCKIHK